MRVVANMVLDEVKSLLRVTEESQGTRGGQ
jgi:hypothetical protein